MGEVDRHNPEGVIDPVAEGHVYESVNPAPGYPPQRFTVTCLHPSGRWARGVYSHSRSQRPIQCASLLNPTLWKRLPAPVSGTAEGGTER